MLNAPSSSTADCATSVTMTAASPPSAVYAAVSPTSPTAASWTGQPKTVCSTVAPLYTETESFVKM